jgi:D-alanine--poly(phosphoribitol) ligase subunit 1
MDLYPSLSTGSTLASLTRDDIADFSRLYRTLRAADLTVWVSTPSFARLCLAEPSFAAPMLPRLRRFLFCGETLTPDDARQLLVRFPDAAVWNTYGPTEATVATTSIRVTPEVLARHPVLPVGRTKPGTIVRITADGTLNPVPDGELGEIVIAGDNVSPGYVGDPVLTCRKFQRLEGLPAYRTGDLGRFEDGLLFFHGRRDDQIKLHGHRIELGDVEANLCAIQGVSAAVVLPVTRNGAVDALAAFVIAPGQSEESEPARLRWLRGEVQRQLPRYMQPRTIRFVDRFPMTANGKIDRRELLARL